MVDPKEEFKHAAAREFCEEAAAGVDAEHSDLAKLLNRAARLSYSGCQSPVLHFVIVGDAVMVDVDDNRATDNAWTETQLFHFDASTLKEDAIPLKFSGMCNLCALIVVDHCLRIDADDAIGVKWMRIDDPVFSNPDTFHGHHRDLSVSALHQI
jgi:hypothetical protein